MNIFFGAFEHPDTFYRVATIIAVSSIESPQYTSSG
jgi:hypothetical protein